MNRQQRRHPERHPQQKVTLGFCHPGQVAAQFMESVVQVQFADTRLTGMISQRSGPRVAEARNLIVRKFLTEASLKDVEWLWMVDADMTFPPDTLHKLLAVADPQHPLIGGLCFGGGDGHPIFPTLYKLKDATGEFDAIEDYPENSLVRVDATGAACLLIHCSVLEQMWDAFKEASGGPNPYPWFVEGMASSTGKPVGEDIAFCMKANSLGIPLYVHTGVEIGHRKSSTLDTEAFRAQNDRLSAAPLPPLTLSAGNLA